MTKLNKNTMSFLGIAMAVSMLGVFTLGQGTAQSGTGIQTEGSKMLGHVTLVAYGPDGQVKAYRQTDNLVVTIGDNATANKMFGTSLTTTNTVGTFTCVGVGDSNTAAAVTQTALSHQISNHRCVSAANGSIHGTALINNAQWAANRITNSSTVNIQEAGLFDGGNGTNMFARQTFSQISMNPADTLSVSWTITIT